LLGKLDEAEILDSDQQKLGGWKEDLLPKVEDEVWPVLNFSISIGDSTTVNCKKVKSSNDPNLMFL
jgi:hypothetical protein